MTAQKKPTLQDIYRILGKHDEILSQILEQAKKTNGRVTRHDNEIEDLQRKEAGRKILEEYKEKVDGRPTTTVEKEGWTTREKALIAIIMALITIAGGAIGTKV